MGERSQGFRVAIISEVAEGLAAEDGDLQRWLNLPRSDSESDENWEEVSEYSEWRQGKDEATLSFWRKLKDRYPLHHNILQLCTDCGCSFSSWKLVLDLVIENGAHKLKSVNLHPCSELHDEVFAYLMSAFEDKREAFKEVRSMVELLDSKAEARKLADRDCEEDSDEDSKEDSEEYCEGDSEEYSDETYPGCEKCHDKSKHCKECCEKYSVPYCEDCGHKDQYCEDCSERYSFEYCEECYYKDELCDQCCGHYSFEYCEECDDKDDFCEKCLESMQLDNSSEEATEDDD